MSALLDHSGRAPASGRGSGAGAGPRSPVPAGLLAALQAAAASLVVILVPVVLGWATASFSRAPWGQAVRLGVDTWLLAHHTGIAISGGHVGLVPLGLLLVPLLSCWFAGVRLARALDPNAAAIRDGVGRARPARPPAQGLLALILGYACLVTLAGATATVHGARPLIVQAFVGSLLICAAGASCGAGAWVAGGVLPGLRFVVRELRVPPVLRACLRPAAVVLAVQLGAALVLFLAALLLGWDRVLLLHRSLAPGLVGGIVLVLSQALAVPNLVIFGGSYLTGPGFAVGAGTSLSPGRTDLGALPAVPVLGALPAPGVGPVWLWGVLAVPVLAGALGAYLLVRRGPDEPWRDLLRAGAVSAVLAAAGWAVLAWLSGGPAGPGRLAAVGPSAWQQGLAFLAEAGAGALLVIGCWLAARALRGAGPQVSDAV